MAGRFFQALKVLELASVLAGPAVGTFFAELGAQVIKVEPPLGDITRSWRLATESTESDISAYFASVNWGKRSLAVNLKTQEGQALVQALAARSDVVIANFKPGDAEKLHMDYASLSAHHSGLIYAHLTGYGPENPRSGFDALIQAETGFVHLNGEAQGPGLKMPVALIDLLAAHQLKEAILVALLERQSHGRGTYISVGLFQSSLVSLANQASAWLVAGQNPVRMGSEHPSIVPYGSIYTCADGKQIMLAVGNDAQFQALCEVLHCQDLAQDVRFQSNPQRVKYREVLQPLLIAAISKQPRDSLLQALWRKHVPAAALYTVAEALAQPEAQPLLMHARSTGMMGLRTLAFEPPQGKLNLTPPPHLGEHSQEILLEMGYSLDMIQDWRARNIVIG